MPTPPIRACLALDKCMSQIAVDEAHSGIFTQKVRNLRRGLGLGHPEADIHSVDFFHRRILDRTAVEEVATCGFIGRVENVALQGLTGMGKTCIVCAGTCRPRCPSEFFDGTVSRHYPMLKRENTKPTTKSQRLRLASTMASTGLCGASL